MKKFLLAGAAAILTLAASQAQAADTMGADQGATTQGSTGTMGQGTGGAMGTMGLMGKVKDIDKKKNLLTLQVQLAPDATVTREGKTVGLNQLKKGEDVRASFDPTTNTITQVNIQPKGAMKNQGQNQNMNQ